MDLTGLFKTSIDASVEGLVLNVDYFENRRRNFIQKKYGRKRCLPARTFRSLDCNFFFVRTFYTLMIPKGKRRIRKAFHAV